MELRFHVIIVRISDAYCHIVVSQLGNFNWRPVDEVFGYENAFYMVILCCMFDQAVFVYKSIIVCKVSTFETL